MKLTTLNLQGFIDWEKRKSPILTYLRQENPDVILFQEVVFLPDISPYTQVHLLNDSLGYTYSHSAVTRLQKDVEHETYREGLALLSKFPITQTESLVLKQAAGDPHQRIIQLADVNIHDKIIHIANIHPSLSTPLPDYATTQFREILELLATRNEQRIIAGDFNLDNPEQAGVQWTSEYLTSRHTTQYLSQVNAVVEGGTLQDRCTDHIWIPKHYQFNGDIRVSPDDLSDHRAVSATITL